MKVVIKIGGHIFDSITDSQGIEAYSKLLRKLRSEGHRIVAIMGGGEEARRYIKAAKGLGGSDFACDLLGIDVCRLNARLLIISLGEDAYPEPPRTVEDLRKAIDGGKIVVVGGFQPGQSTNAVAALAAEAVGADLFVNATDVDGVYTSDPKKNPKAKKLDVVTTDKLLTLALKGKLEAGGYALFDPVAIRMVERSRIPTRIVDGRRLTNIELAVKGENVGTLVVASGGDRT